MKKYAIEGISAIETTERLHVFTWLKKIRRWDEYKHVLELARAKPDQETHALFVGVHHEDVIAAHYLCHLIVNPPELTRVFCIVLFPFNNDDKDFASFFVARLASGIMKATDAAIAAQQNGDDGHE
jgi:hypothetical protein